MTGTVTLEAWEGTRRVARHVGPNLLTAVGINVIRNRMIVGHAQRAPTLIAVGSGTEPPTVSDVNLGVSRDLYALTSGSQTASNQWTYYHLLTGPQSNGWTLTEYGLWTPAMELVARHVAPPVVKTAAIKLHIWWALTFTQAP